MSHFLNFFPEIQVTLWDKRLRKMLATLLMGAFCAVQFLTLQIPGVWGAGWKVVISSAFSRSAVSNDPWATEAKPEPHMTAVPSQVSHNLRTWLKYWVLIGSELPIEKFLNKSYQIMIAFLFSVISLRLSGLKFFWAILSKVSKVMNPEQAD